ncbi:hypothetical protein [Clostridium sp.]|uniref:hypothetical protein n=1 Tax=Clostridium sp. TaxID=1506 RepID=UPI0039950234
MNLDGRKIAKYTLIGVGVYVALDIAFKVFNIVFNIAFKSLILIAIIAFISYLVRKN